MAAEEMARAGLSVTILDAKPSPARKFLMAGKSGLNLTKAEAPDRFLASYDCPENLSPILRDFGPDAVMAWARGLGVEVFTGSTGRVFPMAMKASPLLRAWLLRLDGLGVTLKSRWRWTGFVDGGSRFDTPQGPATLPADVTVLAMGGASWARLGSDGAWVPALTALGVPITPWQPTNMGLVVDWSPHMARYFGQAVKGAALMIADRRTRGEFVVSARGIEGGGIYAMSAALRQGAPLALDLMADLSVDQITDRLDRMRPGESLTNRLRKLGLSPVAAGLVMEWGRGLDPVAAIKHLPVRHSGPRPIDEAISVAGGIAWTGLTNDLELTSLPGVFAAGEMLDWEAPTGGYLLTACLATGRWAGRAAVKASLST
jgi:uncharacterized flavoprotein (TIGR03862 family)